jgi:xanthine/uracil permease
VEPVVDLITIAVSFGAGSIPAAQPTFFQSFPEELQMVLGSGIVVTAVVAITLNVLFNHVGSRSPKKAAEHQDWKGRATP